jgi:hypothetical protein
MGSAKRRDPFKAATPQKVSGELQQAGCSEMQLRADSALQRGQVLLEEAPMEELAQEVLRDHGLIS